MSKRLKVVLHGGMHKTATTAIQRLLASERDELLAHGYVYPDCGAPDHNAILNTRHPGWTPEALLDALSLVREAGAPTVVFSAEIISILSAAEIARLREHLGDSEVLFVVAFRHWCDYLPSRWAQNCKRRDSQSFREYLDNLRNRYPGHPDVSYATVLSGMRSLRGTRVRAVSYSNASHTPASAVAEVLSAMELPPELVGGLASKEQRYNAREDWTVVEKLRLLNGALSRHLGLAQNDLFEAFGAYRVRDMAFDLNRFLTTFDPADMAALDDVVRLDEVVIRLSSNDAWFTCLNDEFQRSCAHYFVNLSHREIFAGSRRSEVRCTDLRWEDALAPGLLDTVRQMSPASLGRRFWTDKP